MTPIILSPEQNGLYIADDIFRCIFVEENYCNLIIFFSNCFKNWIVSRRGCLPHYRVSMHPLFITLALLLLNQRDNLHLDISQPVMMIYIQISKRHLSYWDLSKMASTLQTTYLNALSSRIIIVAWLYPDSKVQGANMGPIWTLLSGVIPSKMPLRIELAISRFGSGKAFVLRGNYLNSSPPTKNGRHFPDETTLSKQILSKRTLYFRSNFNEVCSYGAILQ